MGLADYEDDADDSAPPAVPANVPNLADVMTEKSRGLEKPYEVQGASHLDEIPDFRKMFPPSFHNCTDSEVIVTQEYRRI